MDTSWDSLEERSQLALSRGALERAVGIVAERAETLANEIECGSVADRGGVEALRLFATLTRGGGVVVGDIHRQIGHGQVGHG